MKGIYWLFYLLFVLGFGVISCSGDDPIVDSEGNIGSNGDDESNGEGGSQWAESEKFCRWSQI